MTDLSDARDVAAQVLTALEDQGAFLQPALEAGARRAELEPRDRAFALDLVMGVTRWRNRLDHTLDQLLKRGVSGTPPGVVQALRLGAYQLLFQRGAPHAAVHCAVTQARRAAGEPLARVTNGVLRRLQREGEHLPEGDEPEALAVRWGHPEWLVRRWLTQLGPEEAEQVAAAHNHPAPLTIRPDHPEADRAALAERLRAEGATVDPTALAPDGLRVTGHPAPFAGAAFREGWWVAQDEASQLVVHLLDARPGHTVWDACAAPGGKTRYLARLMEDRGRLLATDVHPRKAKRLGAALTDLECVEVRQHDATDPPQERFDRVLLDAPCSGLGVLRRHPEIKWRRTEVDITRNAERQATLLRSTISSLAPGGALVYSVCSDAPEEGPDVVEALLKDHVDLSCDEVLEPRPHTHGTDGFYAARLRLSDRETQGEP